MLVDFVSVGLIVLLWVIITFVLVLFALQSKKKSRIIWVFVFSSIVLAVLWYLSYNGTLPVCDLLKCGGG